MLTLADLQLAALTTGTEVRGYTVGPRPVLPTLAGAVAYRVTGAGRRELATRIARDLPHARVSHGARWSTVYARKVTP